MSPRCSRGYSNLTTHLKPGLNRDSNPGPLAPKARIIPLDHWATKILTVRSIGIHLPFRMVWVVLFCFITSYFKQRPFNLWSTSARLAQSVEHQTLNLRVVGSSPTLGEAFSTKVSQLFDLMVSELWEISGELWRYTMVYCGNIDPLQKPSERFELSTPGLQDQCSNHWATKARAFQNKNYAWLLKLL